MTITPEQIAAQILENEGIAVGRSALETLAWEKESVGDMAELISLILDASKTLPDREVIAQKVWTIEDVEGALKERLEETGHTLSSEDFEAVVEESIDEIDTRVLRDCTDEEWGEIQRAVEDTLEGFQTRKHN